MDSRILCNVYNVPNVPKFPTKFSSATAAEVAHNAPAAIQYYRFQSLSIAFNYFQSIPIIYYTISITSNYDRCASHYFEAILRPSRALNRSAASSGLGSVRIWAPKMELASALITASLFC